MEPALKKSKIDTTSLPIEIYGNILSNYYDKESDIASLLKLRTVNQSFRQEIKRLLASSLEGSIYNFIFDLIHLENEITNFDKEQHENLLNSYLRFYLPLTSVEKGLEGLLKTLTNQRKFLAILTNRENALSKLEDEPDASTLARIMSFSMTSNLKKIEEWTDKVFPFLSESMFNFQMEVNPINLRLIKPIEDSDKLSKALLSVNMLLFGGATRSDPELYFEFSISTETEWLRTFLFNSRPDEAKDDEEVPGQRRRRMTSKVEPERKQSRRSDSAARERRAKRIGLQGHRVLFHSQVDDSSAFEQCFVAEELLRMFIKVLIVSVAEGSSQYSQEQQMKHFLDFVDSEALEGLLNSLFSNQFISSKLFNRLPSWLPLRKFISATLKHRTEEFSPQLPSRIQENKPGRIDSGSFSTILGIRQFATMQGIGRKSEIYENDT